MIIYYLVGVIILLYIIRIIYIKIKYPFWSIQPVYHRYDISYKWRTPFVIDNLPLMNKYCNFMACKTAGFAELSSEDTQIIVNFLATHYLRTSNVNYIPTIESVNSQFSNHSFSPCITTLTQPKLLINYENQSYIDSKEILGVITSRPVYITINTSSFVANYIDYMCIHSDYRKSGFAEELIQTHNFNQYQNNTNILVSLFKHEDMTSCVKPVVEYSTYAYLKIKVNRLHPSVNIFLVTPQSFGVILHFIKKNKSNFDFTITPNTANVIELIKNKIIWIYALKIGTEIIACYFFRNTYTLYTGKSSFELFASINKCSKNVPSLFFFGFTAAYRLLAKSLKTKIILIENTSHNNEIITAIKSPIYFTSYTALFFYNYFSQKQIPAERTFFIC